MVPSVVGNYWQTAEPLIEAQGLVPRQRTEGLSSGWTTDRNVFPFVVRQSPEPGRFVAPGTWVICWVEYRGPGWGWDRTTVPDVVGMPLARALERVREAGLSVTSQSEAGGEGPLVVRVQSPPAGHRVVEDSRVHLLARHERPAAGPDVVRVGALVPNLIGRGRADAERALGSAGLVANWLGEPRGAVVYQQSPGGGVRLRPGSAVHVWLRAAPGPTSVVVPNVVGRPESQAAEVLRSARLSLVRASGPAGGRVVRQQPPAGFRVPVDSPVRVTLESAAVALEAVVPNVVGRTAAEANAMLSGAGLRARRLGRGSGRVIRQTPAGGSRLPRGAEVSLAFGK
jgi:beta-lactam-binding protein with PASTA domain